MSVPNTTPSKIIYEQSKVLSANIDANKRPLTACSLDGCGEKNISETDTNLEFIFDNKEKENIQTMDYVGKHRLLAESREVIDLGVK